ncbi:CoA transferase [Sphaerisporangium aureirubrum]|uniref:CoA transferase n=1 Tax=Sphaerisporangium aureirubrum TaxID=1544736 RepID=A0ABW1NQW3_9ACTN
MDGERVVSWAPLSGDYRAADGWVRLHCNFDHHRDAALRALGLSSGAGREEVVEACGRRAALEIEEAVTEAAGCAAAMRSRTEWAEHPHGRAVALEPLIRLRRLADGRGAVAGGQGDGAAGGHVGGPGGEARGTPGRALAGVRVVDLTRVIAGPVAGRVLAGFGAEVVRVGAEHLPEVPGLVICTAFGKRSCEVDLRTKEGAEALRGLVAGADVVVQGYRPGALAGLGFGAEELAAIRPGVVCVDVSAYRARGPWGGRRGFDSLVQMASGIAHEGGDGGAPVPLPAQVLDHATGWLAAFAAVAALLRRRTEGGSWHAELSLARTAKWLDGLGRVAGPTPQTVGEVVDMSRLMGEMESSFGRLSYVRQPGAINGVRPRWTTPPPRRGEHPPRWPTERGGGS